MPRGYWSDHTRPPREPKTHISVAIPVSESNRWRELARQQNLTLTQLVTKAIAQVYPPKDGPR